MHLIVDNGEGVRGDGEVQDHGLAGLEVDAAKGPEGPDGNGYMRVEGGDIDLGHLVTCDVAGVGYLYGKEQAVPGADGFLDLQVVIVEVV